MSGLQIRMGRIPDGQNSNAKLLLLFSTYSQLVTTAARRLKHPFNLLLFTGQAFREKFSQLLRHLCDNVSELAFGYECAQRS